MTTFDVELRLSTDLVAIVTDVWGSFLLGDVEVRPPAGGSRLWSRAPASASPARGRAC